MQRRKSFFNNEMEQRFSLRKYTIGLCSVCLGFVTIGMGSQSVKADTVNNVEKSSVVQENKTQDADSATAKPNITPTETKKNEVGSVATTAPKTNTASNGVKANTADSAISTETKPTKANSTLANSNIVSAQAKSAKAELVVQPKVGATSTKIKLQETKLAKSSDANNAVVVNTSDQSKSEDSSAVAPTSEKTQLQTSQDSSIKVKENNLNNKSNAMKAVFKLTNLNKENNSSDPNSKDAEVKPKESSNLDTNEQKENDVSAASASTVLSKQPANAGTPSTADNMAADSAPTTLVTNKASHESNSQAQPSSSIDNTQTKLVRRPVMRLAVTAATNSDELIVGKDVTISDFSVTTANGKNEFENSHANIKFTMHADDPSTLVGKRLTIQLKKIWQGFYHSKNQEANPTTISYRGQVIGNLNYGYPFNFVYITFNNHVKDYTSINLQSDLVVAGNSQNSSLYQTDLYTPTQAKDGQTYHLTNDIVIGQQKYSSNLPSTIHYRKLGSDSISSVTNLTTTSYGQNDRELYAGTFYKTPDGIYYSRSSYYSSNNLYDTKSGQPGYLQGFYLYVGTDTITDHTRSYTATFDIDQTKLSPDPDTKLVPIDSYYLTKYYWDDEKLLPNTSDVYTDYSSATSSTATADATVTKNSVIFNKLNGQSLVTQEISMDNETAHISYSRNFNYISQNGQLYITPVLFKQLQAVAESDQNLTEAINTVTTTGRDAKIKLANPIDTGVKATIKTSDGKTKELSLLIDTIGYATITASTAPRGSILVSAQGKTAKVYHPGDQNIPAVVDQSQLIKTITRTINVHEPGKSVITTKQTVTLTQSVSVVDGKDVTYNGDWKVQGDSQWASYDVPSVPGYTASQSSVAQQEVTDATKDKTVNITYSANDGTQTIVYQDEDGSEIGKQVISGKTDEKVKVTPDIPDGYVIKGEVPSEVTIKPDDTPITVTVEHGKSHVTPDKPVNKGDLIEGTKDKHYPEGLTHDDLNKTITREVTITDPSGKKSTTAQTVTFTRGATVDEVTNKVTYDDWSENGKHTFDKVDVPTVPGYTVSGEVPEVVVTPETQSSKVDITYTANAQTATITYIDDTEKKSLGSDKQNGKFNQVITFEHDPAEVIKGLEEKGYKLVSNDFNSNKYQADNSNNVFYVHLKHGTSESSRKDDVNMTVHYVMDDGSKAPSDSTQTVSFTENGIKDNVTGNITWTPATSQTLKDVDSPVLTGYTADIKTANGKVVNFGDPDINVTVHYSANAQTATITYIDDTEKKTLGSDKQNGKFNQVITFEHDPAEVIKGLEEKGYKLVSNDFNDNKYQADNSNNVFYVHLTHDTKKVSQEHSASFTVHYIYKDGRQAKPDHEQTLRFTENGIQDLVTQKITWTPADSQKFDDVVTPVITGYAPDQDKVIGQIANFETGDRKVTVTYLPDVQLGHINYIDDSTDKTLTRDDFSGKTNEHEDYTPIDRIQEFENKGYELVSNDYPDGGFNFDDNDQQDQVFNVHLKHGIVTGTTKKPQMPNMPIDPDPQSPKYPKDISNTNSDVKRTIDYKYSDGKTAQPTVNDSLHFERTVVIDKVTGEVLSDTWTPSQDFNDIQTPVIQGYTPDKTVVSDKNIGHDHQNVVEHVVYSPNAQHMAITYVDDTTGETLKRDKLDGTSDQDTKYTTGDNIKRYTDLHYKLVSDSTNGQDLIFDHNDKVDQAYEVHFIHGTQKVNRQDTVTSTINYKFEDGKTAQPTVTQTKHFSEDGVKDLVTGKIAWDEAKPQKFDDIATKSIVGYTPDKDKVAGSVVKFGDQDVEVTVTYHNNVQTAKITYIDDTEKKSLGSDKQNGKFNQVITFEHDPAEVIKGLEEKGYKLVSDNFKSGVKYQNDNKSNSFEVHLVHSYEPVETSQTITETVHYIDANGKPVAPDHVATVVVKVTGTRDKVTDSITWNTPSAGHFDKVISPKLPNMIPDKKLIPGRDVQYGDSDITESVVYTPYEIPREPEEPNAQGKTDTKKDDSKNSTSTTDSAKKDDSKKDDSRASTSKTSEKPIDSRTVDNHASAKSTAKQELPQTGTATNTGIWTGVVSLSLIHI